MNPQRRNRRDDCEGRPEQHRHMYRRRVLSAEGDVGCWSPYGGPSRRVTDERGPQLDEAEALPVWTGRASPTPLSGNGEPTASEECSISGAMRSVVERLHAVAEAGEQGAAGQRFVDAEGAAAHRTEDDYAFGSEDDLMARRQLRSNPRITHMLERFFELFDTSMIPRERMIEFEVLCCKALFDPDDFDEVRLLLRARMIQTSSVTRNGPGSGADGRAHTSRG